MFAHVASAPQNSATSNSELPFAAFRVPTIRPPPHNCGRLIQIVKGCLLYTRIPKTWCMYPSTKRRASSDTLVPETDSMHPVIQLHFSTQPFDSCRFQVQLPSIFAEPEWGLLRTRPKYTALRPLGQSPQAPFSYISVVMDCGIHFFRKASL